MSDDPIETRQPNSTPATTDELGEYLRQAIGYLSTVVNDMSDAPESLSSEQREAMGHMTVASWELRQATDALQDKSLEDEHEADAIATVTALLAPVEPEEQPEELQTIGEPEIVTPESANSPEPIAAPASVELSEAAIEAIEKFGFTGIKEVIAARILSTANRGKWIARADITTGLTFQSSEEQRQIFSRVISKLVHAGILTRDGSTRATRYRVHDEGAPTESLVPLVGQRPAGLPRQGRVTPRPAPVRHYRRVNDVDLTKLANQPKIQPAVAAERPDVAEPVVDDGTPWTKNDVEIALVVFDKLRFLTGPKQAIELHQLLSRMKDLGESAHELRRSIDKLAARDYIYVGKKASPWDEDNDSTRISCTYVRLVNPEYIKQRLRNDRGSVIDELQGLINDQESATDIR